MTVPEPGRVPEPVTAPGPGSDAVDPLAARVVTLLTARGGTLAVAESLTGGALASRLVAVPGASVVLRGAVVAYATDLKASLLGVDAALLAERGAVDPDVARQMAEGVRMRLGAEFGVATTGAAGPTGQDGQPPGTLHVAVASAGGSRARSAVVPGSRAVVRGAAVELALTLLLDEIARGPQRG